ncbi:MAG: alpha amylase N-terminal ig-like domain-containing protein, partial [Lachnospiraceae bacterium]|nr:alpha amylase N-terminal ig-like domain-containing protein [Lachnospiraceae bacterium]
MDQKKKRMMKRLDYFIHMRPVFDVQSLFSDGTENFVSPMEPKPGDRVKIRFRTKRDNADVVFFISGAMKKPMEVESSDSRFDYYATEITVGEEPVYYYFEVQAGKVRCFYTRLGVSRNLNQSRLFCLVPGFSTPDWAKGAVMYQIFTERFYNGDSSNDVLEGEYIYLGKPVTRVPDWEQPPAADGTREFYGGDLQGIWDKLDYLQELGVEVLYLNPVFVSPSNHKYDTQDYDYIDPHIGRIVTERETCSVGTYSGKRSDVGYPNRMPAETAENQRADRMSAETTGNQRTDRMSAEIAGNQRADRMSAETNGNCRADQMSAKAAGGYPMDQWEASPAEASAITSNRDAKRYIARVTDIRNLEASNAFFAEFVEEVHRRGMRVILDGVFNHCGSFNKWMDRERIYEGQPGYEKGAYVSEKSPYRSFFKFNNEHEWPYNSYYEGWWGYETLPKLN